MCLVTICPLPGLNVSLPAFCLLKDMLKNTPGTPWTGCPSRWRDGARDARAEKLERERKRDFPPAL